MKKVLALILFVVMMMTLSVTAFAAEPNKELTVTYEVNPTYTVTIPATFDANKDATITVDANPVITYGTQIKVAVTGSANYDSVNNQFRLKNTENQYIGYTLSSGDDAIALNDVVLTQNAGATTAAVVTISFTPEAATYAGTYRDTITFTISTN